jgi:hypothetical protein
VAQREWFNDPIPTRYEPTFTGTVERDSMGRFFMRVQSALGDQGQNQTATYQGKAFLLTTRLTDTTATNHGGQPGPHRFDLQERSSATNGGAAQFTARNWDSLVGRQVSLQGHLMTHAVSETGLTYQGQRSGVFSAFRIL